MKKILLLLCVVFPLVAFGAPPLTRVEVLRQEGGGVMFFVEVVNTEAEMQQGLMGRTLLAADRGMLFDFGEAKPVAMWMKNTLIPLDMLFVNDQGMIVFIAENTTPESLKKITAGQPVRYVLEVRGGTANRAKIRRGDRLWVP